MANINNSVQDASVQDVQDASDLNLDQDVHEGQNDKDLDNVSEDVMIRMLRQLSVQEQSRHQAPHQSFIKNKGAELDSLNKQDVDDNKDDVMHKSRARKTGNRMMARPEVTYIHTDDNDDDVDLPDCVQISENKDVDTNQRLKVSLRTYDRNSNNESGLNGPGNAQHDGSSNIKYDGTSNTRYNGPSNTKHNGSSNTRYNESSRTMYHGSSNTRSDGSSNTRNNGSSNTRHNGSSNTGYTESNNEIVNGSSNTKFAGSSNISSDHNPSKRQMSKFRLDPKWIKKDEIKKRPSTITRSKSLNDQAYGTNIQRKISYVEWTNQCEDDLSSRFCQCQIQGITFLQLFDLELLNVYIKILL